MSKRHALKRRLFEQGIAAAKVALGTSDTYFCPLCGQPFDASGIVDGTLTLEHVPPKSQGGRQIILTCFGCNSIAGSSIDAAAANRDAVFNFVKIIRGESQGEAGRTTVKIDDWGLNVDIRGDDRGNKISIPAACNDPAAMKGSADYFRHLAHSGDGAGVTMKITALPRYHKGMAYVSMLKTAFLACVAALGYKFAFAPALRRVREQILRPNQPILPPWVLHPTQAIRAPAIGLSEHLGVIFVALDESAVILPWPPSGEDAFNTLSATAVQGQPFNMKGLEIPWPRSFVAAIDNSG